MSNFVYENIKFNNNVDGLVRTFISRSTGCVIGMEALTDEEVLNIDTLKGRYYYLNKDMCDVDFDINQSDLIRLQREIKLKIIMD